MALFLLHKKHRKGILMNKKVSLGVAISLIAVACAITFVLTMTVSLNMYNSMVAGVQERETINAKVKEIDSFVRSASIYTIDDKDILYGIMDGYVNGVNDEYAVYYTAEEYYTQQQIESGVIIGTGLITEISGDYLTVTGVYDDSSAKNLGIAKGWTITWVDGKNLLEIGAEKAQQLLEGEDGTKVSVIVKTEDDTEKAFNLVRQQIKLNSVSSALIDGYAYIKISTFNQTTADQFLALIEKYEAQSVLGYILDVRDNDIGITTGLTAMLNRFLPAATASYSIDKSGTKTGIITTDGNTTLNKPIVVLVNGKSACASELFAAALKDYGNAVLIGTVTRGKADLQTTQVFKDGSAVTITTAKAYPADSESFDKVGLMPQYIVEMTAEEQAAVEFANASTDKQLQKALEIIATL